MRRILLRSTARGRAGQSQARARAPAAGSFCLQRARGRLAAPLLHAGGGTRRTEPIERCLSQARPAHLLTEADDSIL